ncbi:DUF4395 domain-containing protein [Longispora albida]|uniref:DUF4395 domain-containing protein n=1 Tax=Longispora albida TaxID=203523 RepID=UPI0003A3A8DC|nr:DUF4395 domain-containing protein [Longispora albida]
MQIDPRGPRFAAAVTTVVFVLILVTGSGWLALAQAAVFALGTAGQSPYAMFFKAFVRPRLGPPSEMEDAAPVRFAQAVGLFFALVAAAGYLLDLPVAGMVAAAFALVAAFLNAAFGLCLGCEVFLLYRRARG